MPFATQRLSRLGAGPQGRRRWCLLVVITAVSLLATAHLEAQGFQDLFRQGIQALDEGDWQAAERWMSQAIGQRPVSSQEKIRIYGMRFERYLPYFHLARARQALGNCNGVLAALSTETRMGVVRGIQEREMQTMAVACGGSLGPVAQSSPPPRRSAPPTAPPPRVKKSRTPRTAKSRPATGRQSPSSRPTSSSKALPPPKPPAASTVSATSSATATSQVPKPTQRKTQPMGKSTDSVRRQVIKQKIQAAGACLTEATRWIAALDVSAQKGRWRPSAKEQKHLEAIRKTVGKARFRLQQGESEGDLKALEKALSEACDARADLAGLGRGVAL